LFGAGFAMAALFSVFFSVLVLFLANPIIRLLKMLQIGLFHRTLQ